MREAGLTGAKKIQKMENGHETNKYPTKSDENRAIGIAPSRRTFLEAGPKQIPKRSNFWILAHFGY